MKCSICGRTIGTSGKCFDYEIEKLYRRGFFETAIKLLEEHEHVHRFYPTGDKRSIKMEDEIKDAIGSDKYSTRHLSMYDDIEYKFICECGLTKWVREK